ncbi:hypothetical protein PSACC_03053 [Paramicrosporidium saccamoebae]|uniref:Uncharacterized protein n=1 Tax=Paramicrosporidium saccamoebae TaxID=1246581 RepID=A0A2H9THN7_9FUNG|nr:hypothetical protein PSACC_03053 [Paramicrosporidium saccamoebae]
MNTDAELSTRDQEIIARIFNQGKGELMYRVNRLELYDVGANGKGQDVRVNRPLSETERRAAGLEVEAIKAAEEDKDFERAALILTKAVEQCPSYPSPYNNRAQVYRLQNNLDLAICDLDRAIALSQEFPVVRRQALCQRAWIRYSRGETEVAYKDFEAAGNLGDADARRMAVRCNPYARLCNNIVQGMLERLYYSKHDEV